MIKNNINGFSFLKGNHIQLAKIIVKISNNDIKKITHKSIKDSLNKYDIDRTVDAILNIN